MRIVLLLLVLALNAAAQAQLEFEYGGVTRTYFMDAPDPIPTGAPLVVVLHGYTSSAMLIRAYSNWDDLALSEGFVAVFPQGTQDDLGINHWNTNLGSNTDDHGFLVALVQHLQQEYDLSTSCTYACGMSNGGFMSYSLACEHPEVFSAIGSVTGAMSSADFGCTPSTVVPIIHLHGTADLTVPYDGGVGGPWGLSSIPDIVEHWTGLMGTTTFEETPLPNQETIDLTSADFLRYAGAPGGQEFHHYRINGGGHEWFGAWGSPEVESTEVLWDFFAAQCAGEFTAVEDLTVQPDILTPLGRGVQANVDCHVEVVDLLGRRMQNIVLRAGEHFQPAGTGFTLLKARAEGRGTEVTKLY